MRKIIAKGVFTTTITACLIINFAAIVGCVMDPETYDIEAVDQSELVAVELETDMTATESRPTVITEVQPEVEVLAPECEPGTECIVLEPTIVESPMTVLEVGIDHFLSGVRVINDMDETIVALDASDCPQHENGYRVCEIELVPGKYTVAFNYVHGYETPDYVEVDLTENGTAVYGYYAKDFEETLEY